MERLLEVINKSGMTVNEVVNLIKEKINYKNRVYIAGKITDDPDYKKKFNILENKLIDMGYIVMNPAILPNGFEYENYFHINYPMIDVCGTICFMKDYKESDGAIREYDYSKMNKKKIVFEEDLINK